MSDRSSTVTPRHFQYIASHARPEDAFLKQLKQAAQDAGIPPIWVAPEQASLIHILLKSAKAKEVVEVGTLAGYSAIVMARALASGGRVRTIEVNALRADFAEAWVAKSDVADRVKVYRGKGRDVLPLLETDSADAAFLDADKANYPFYLEASLRIVRSGGLIMVDNAFAFGELFDEAPQDPETDAVKSFNEIMAAEGRLQSVIVPLGDGLWVGVKA